MSNQPGKPCTAYPTHPSNTFKVDGVGPLWFANDTPLPYPANADVATSPRDEVAGLPHTHSQLFRVCSSLICAAKEH